MTASAAKRRVHEHQAMPRLAQAIVGLGVDLFCWHPVIGTRRAGLEVEHEPEHFEVFGWCKPFRGLKRDRELMLSHECLPWAAALPRSAFSAVVPLPPR